MSLTRNAKSNLKHGRLFMAGMFGGWHGVKGYVELVKKMAFESGVVPHVDLSPEAKALMEREAGEN